MSRSIWKTSKKFDLDTKGQQTNFDSLIRENVVQKTLERDSLIYVEGERDNLQPNFITQYEFNIEKAKRENWENQSSGDYKEDFAEKFESIEDRVLNHPGWFERNPYFERIFPSLNIQKPGYDLYGTTTSILGFIGIYIFMYYESYSFSQMKFDFAAGQSVVFPGEMAVTVLFIIMVIIVERYANRSDTKKIEEDNKLVESADKEKK